MFAKEIQSFKSWLECTPVAHDRLWNRKLEAISPLEIQLFYARAGLRGHKTSRSRRSTVSNLRSSSAQFRARCRLPHWA